MFRRAQFWALFCIFCIHANDLENAFDAKITMYADDTALILSNKSNLLLEENGNIILEKIENWFSSNSLFLNTNKTKVIRFHNRQKDCSEITFNYNNKVLITNGCSTKFLSIHFDECLNWKQHCQNVVTSLASASYLFRNLRNILEEAQLKMIYFAKVESLLRYGILMKLAPKVCIVQKRVIRIIAGVVSTGTGELGTKPNPS